ncbi:hypothetical protein [Actinacidiphila soli]|uniref:hypothetical protein n=1 Tax=Actinacidiphila soli TaxID=2487275 RepID=UPI000FCA5CA0|nr:hypothetical protein [Actinacidiphila soli]
MWIALAVVAGLMAVVNLTQVFIGRQPIKPSVSKRPAPQLRRESAAASVMMLGVALTALHLYWGGLLVILGFASLLIVRKRSTGS